MKPGAKPEIIVAVVGRNSPVLKQCLQSIAFQRYQDFSVALLDDCSDEQETCVSLAKGMLGKRFYGSFLSRGKRIGKVALYKRMLSAIDPGSFIVNVDSDDYLTRADALSVIASCVQKGAWCVFGRHRNLHGGSSTPDDSRSHVQRLLSGQRDWRIWFDHPHCTYASILKAIPESRLKHEGNYARGCQDRFLFQQAMELSGPDRVVCTEQVIYEYRNPTPHNVHSEEPELIASASGTFFAAPMLFKLGNSFMGSHRDSIHRI